MRRLFVLCVLIASSFLLGADCVPPPDAEVVFGDVEDLPASLDFSVIEGTNPSAQTVALANSGTCALAYSLITETTDSATWLSVSPTSGTIVPSGVAQLTVSIDAATTSLTPGTYTGSIIITATCSVTGNAAVGSPANVAVNLAVTQNAAILGVGDSDLEFDVPSLSSYSWSAMSTTGAPSNRGWHMTAWSGYELYVVGGQNADSSSPTYYATGGAYNPLTDTWRSIADMPSAGSDGIGVYADDRLVVVGAYQGTGSSATAIMTYDPSQDSWSTLTGTSGATSQRWGVSCAVSDGDLVYVWGGFATSGSSVSTNIGFTFDPASGTVTALPSTGQPSNSSGGYCALTGTELLVLTSSQLGRLDIGAGTWTTSTLPSTVDWGPMIWTGKDLVVRGGLSTTQMSTWSRSTNSWVNAPYTGTTSVGGGRAWTGDLMFFPGFGSSPNIATFDPITGSFTSHGGSWSAGVPVYGDSMDWIGDELLLFGGWTNSAGTTLWPGGSRYKQ